MSKLEEWAATLSEVRDAELREIRTSAHNIAAGPFPTSNAEQTLARLIERLCDVLLLNLKVPEKPRKARR
jgi:hypothetical protein